MTLVPLCVRMPLRFVSRRVRFRPYILTSFIRWGAQSDMRMWLMSETKGVEGSLEGGDCLRSTLQLLRLSL